MEMSDINTGDMEFSVEDILANLKARKAKTVRLKRFPNRT